MVTNTRMPGRLLSSRWKARPISAGAKVPKLCRPIRLRKTQMTSAATGSSRRILTNCWSAWGSLNRDRVERRLGDVERVAGVGEVGGQPAGQLGDAGVVGLGERLGGEVLAGAGRGVRPGGRRGGVVGPVDFEVDVELGAGLEGAVGH